MVSVRFSPGATRAEVWLKTCWPFKYALPFEPFQATKALYDTSVTSWSQLEPVGLGFVAVARAVFPVTVIWLYCKELQPVGAGLPGSFTLTAQLAVAVWPPEVTVTLAL